MTAHAEVAQVWPRDGRIKIVGEIVAAETPSDVSWRLRLSSRERRKIKPPAWRRAARKITSLAGREVPPPQSDFMVPVTVDGAGFEADIPLSAFESSDPPLWEHWDLYLVGAADGESVSLRLGKHDDDMPGKKSIVTFPKQNVATRSPLSVRPYFTDNDNLSIRCGRQDQVSP
ncbi:hypothetical protein [Spirillospora sp. NPDC047279]|uniref:hypothetical protein n=1 Tax=Spirillospora sp. NPDC047279 TaxID=3155478 RepID=UPI0033DE7CFC